MAANLRPSSFSICCEAAIELCNAAILNKIHIFSYPSDEIAKKNMNHRNFYHYKREKKLTETDSRTKK